MKTFQLILIFAILCFCFTDDEDQCTIDFENILKEKCEGISTCSFTAFSDHTTRCISTKNTECSRANSDSTLCGKIFPSTFPKQRCQPVGTNCQPVDNFCRDFNTGINGVSFDRIKDRSICDQLKASNGKKCLISDVDAYLSTDTSGTQQCTEYFTNCADITSEDDCKKNLIGYTTTCTWDGSNSRCIATSTTRKCGTTFALNTVTEGECIQLQAPDNDHKCVYSGGRCQAEYISCEKYTIQSSCDGQIPLVQKGSGYSYSDTHICEWVTPSTGSPKCEAVYKNCNTYAGSDSNVCPNLRVTDSTNKRCAYDSTKTSSVCREVYNSCQLYNDKVVSKTRTGCEKIILADSTKKCTYIEEVDKCVETDLYSTCEDYKGTDKYICESIRSPTTNSKCVLEKDRKCIERTFNCTEASNEEDCLYYAKPQDSRKICVYNSDKCYEVYKNCEDYFQTEPSNQCRGLTLYNGKSCYLDSNSRCRSSDKTCSQAHDEDECKLIAETGVSDPDKKVCDYVQYPGKSIQCVENYKYCSDYRGTDSDICTYIKPYDESGKKIDITSKCQYTTDIGCERKSLQCSDVGSNPILCALISEKIDDNNVKYCAYVNDDGTTAKCKEHYKTCESYTGSSSADCLKIIPQNYLTAGQCEWIDSKCKTKTVCDKFKVDDYEYLCLNMPNCTYSSGKCQKNTTIESCKDVNFYISSDENEEVCKNIETVSPNTVCSLREDKSGCEEILNGTNLQTSTSGQENSSKFITKGVHLIMIFLCLFLF